MGGIIDYPAIIIPTLLLADLTKYMCAVDAGEYRLDVSIIGFIDDCQNPWGKKLGQQKRNNIKRK
ncbi:MAG: hypothetical protein IPP73_10040 [Chitinophagaceae bacterium]|nr:hypothetical protein [Chitinophagaceae bacterium]